MSSLSSSRQTGSARCAVWHAPGAAAPSDLLKALSGRGVEPVTVGSAYLALAECCARPGERTALVMVDPEGALPADGVRRMVEAMGKYAPSCPVWVYDERSSHRLRAYAPPAGVAEREPTSRPAQPPRLRLAGEPGPAPEERVASGGGGASGSLLTDEELAMLLTDEPLDPGADRGEA